VGAGAGVRAWAVGEIAGRVRSDGVEGGGERVMSVRVSSDWEGMRTPMMRERVGGVWEWNSKLVGMAAGGENGRVFVEEQAENYGTESKLRRFR
jgi:hypothetical protein